MVVVTIIGILAAMAIPKLQRFIQTAATTEAVDFSGKISRSVSGYVSQHPGITDATLQGAASIGTYNLSCPTGSGLCAAANSVATAIPTLEHPSSLKWLFTVAAKLDDTTGAVETCVMAQRLDAAGTAIDAARGALYFASLGATTLLWEGNVFRAMYFEPTTGFTVGGSCSAATPVAVTATTG